MTKQILQPVLILLIVTLLRPCTILHAGNNDYSEKFEEYNVLYKKDWNPIENGYFQKPASPDAKNDIPTLTDYFNQLEPPDQNGWLGRYSVLGEDTFYFTIPALAAMGIIYLLPEEISNWNKDDVSFGHGWENWKENVASWEWDKDNNWINYIGHPYFGSTYYIYARHYGFSRLESFWFSFTISSIYEIGIEAWAEPVSIQDMIFTPLLGAGLGELLLPLEHQIMTNDKKVLNSRVLGAVSLFLIDPFGHMVLPIKRWTKSWFSDAVEVALAPTYSKSSRTVNNQEDSREEYKYGIHLTFQW